MRLEKRLRKSLILILLISLFPTLGYTQVGKYTQLQAGDPAPFAAWCFDAAATAHIFGTIKHQDEVCNLRLEKELEKQKALYDLQIGNLNLRIDSLGEEKDKLLLIKDEEITRLEEAALKRPNEYNHWWALGGFTVGVLTTLSIFSLFQGG